MDDRCFTKTEMIDVTLNVEGKNLHVSKATVAEISPVFKAMFYGEYKEKQLSQVPLPDKSYTDVLEFLRCVYPPTGMTVKEEHIQSMLALADEYQVDKLRQKCYEAAVDVVEAKGLELSAEKLTEYLLLAEKYDFRDLLDTCVEKGYRNAAAILSEDKVFSSLSQRTKFRLLKKGRGGDSKGV